MHSKKFEMNEDANMILSKNICNLLIIWTVPNWRFEKYLILNKYPPLVLSQDGKLPAATSKWNPHPQWEYQFWAWQGMAD